MRFLRNLAIGVLAWPGLALASETGKKLLWATQGGTPAGQGTSDGVLRGLAAIVGLLVLLALACTWCKVSHPQEGDDHHPR